MTILLSFHFSHKRSNYMSVLRPQSISLSADIDESRVTVCTRTCSGLHVDVTSLNLTSMPGYVYICSAVTEYLFNDFYIFCH